MRSLQRAVIHLLGLAGFFELEPARRVEERAARARHQLERIQADPTSRSALIGAQRAYRDATVERVWGTPTEVWGAFSGAFVFLSSIASSLPASPGA